MRDVNDQAAIVILLGIVFISYRQTITAYPNGGDFYTVARENLRYELGFAGGRRSGRIQKPVVPRSVSTAPFSAGQRTATGRKRPPSRETSGTGGSNPSRSATQSGMLPYNMEKR
jgi:hypothetical protein